MEITSRSMFYTLSPIQSEYYKESLGSYICRLCDAHSISTQVIIEEIVNRLNESNKYILNREYSSVLHQINGMGIFASKWIETLQLITGRNDLHDLNLVNWKNIIKPNSLVRKYKSWCPECLTEMKKESQEVFEPLIWSLQQVLVCPKHNILLQSKCPNIKCNMNIPILGSQSHAGFCSYCGSWLGNMSNPYTVANQDEIWVTRNIQDMVNNNLTPKNLTFNRNGIQIFNIFSPEGIFDQSNTDFLATIFGVHSTTINRWKRGENPPLSTIIDGCFLLQRSPFVVDNSNIDQDNVRSFVIEKVNLRYHEENFINLFFSNPIGFVEKYETSLLTSKSINDFCRRINIRGFVVFHKHNIILEFVRTLLLKNKSYSKNLPENKLNYYLTKNRPQTLCETAKEIGIPIRTLRKISPILCKSIAHRRIQFESLQATINKKKLVLKVFKGVLSLLKEGIYPSETKIAAFLPKKAFLLDRTIRNSILVAKTRYIESKQ
jgi:hypothetical protein